MTKSDVVSVVSEKTGVPRQEAESIINAFIDTVIESMKAHERIEIRGFGTFSTKKTLPRMARNPRTGEPVPIDERIVPIFKISKEFKKSVAGNE